MGCRSFSVGSGIKSIRTWDRITFWIENLIIIFIIIDSIKKAMAFSFYDLSRAIKDNDLSEIINSYSCPKFEET